MGRGNGLADVIWLCCATFNGNYFAKECFLVLSTPKSVFGFVELANNKLPAKSIDSDN